MRNNRRASIVIGMLIIALGLSSVAQAQYNKMMVVGNSLTGGHKTIPGLEWYGLQGMAASEVSKDFVHQLHSKLQADQPGSTLQLEIGHISDEPGSMTGLDRQTVYYNTAITATNADLLVFELGDNFCGTLTWDFFGQNYKNTIQSIAAGGNNPDIYIVGTWMYNESALKTMFIQKVAYEVGATYVSIDEISDDPANWGMNEPYAYPTWSSTGVGTHPGDTGMAKIADKIYSHVIAPDPVIRTPNGPNLLSNGGFEDAAVAVGTSVSTLSLDMNGWTQTGTNPSVGNYDNVFDRTGDDFLIMSQVSSLSQVAAEIQEETKYTFLVDFGYSTNWYGLAEEAFAAIAEFDADGNWIRDLVSADDLSVNQSGIACQVFLEYITGDLVAEGNMIGVRLGIDSIPTSGHGVLWDNASLTAVHVPEPATMGLAALGMLALMRRKR